MKRRLIALILTISMLMSVTAYPVYAESEASGSCGENLTWTFADGVLTIQGTGEMDDYQYWSATPYADYVNLIDEVVISSGVTHIGNFAFGFCGSSDLETITIPDSVTSIGKYAFYSCKASSIIIGENVSTIANYAFAYSSLTSVTIPASVESMGMSLFFECRSLETAVIEEGVITMGDYMFQNCYSLSSVTIPESVTTMGSSVFSGCEGITVVYYGGSENEWNAIANIETTVNSYLLSAEIIFAKESTETEESEETDEEETGESEENEDDDVTDLDGDAESEENEDENSDEVSDDTDYSTEETGSGSTESDSDADVEESTESDSDADAEESTESDSDADAEEGTESEGEDDLDDDTEFRFVDDTDSGTWSWASEYIYACVDAGIINGYSDDNGETYYFSPDDNMTRAEAAKIIAAALDLEIDEDAGAGFSDTGSHWAKAYIEACVDVGIIHGYGDGTFQPEQTISRAEFAKMIACAYNLTSSATESSFDDVLSNHWALTYIEACVERGIINGMGDGTFAPSSEITRAQAAKMIAVAAA